jgi:hypothetical protein
VALGAIGVVAVGVLVWWFVRDPHPPVAVGGRDYREVQGSRFRGGGDLIGDHELLEDAADAWRSARDGLASQVYAVWAGRTPQGRVVILQNRGAFQAVQFNGKDEAVGAASIQGDRLIVSPAGVLVAPGIASRWRAVTLDDESDDGLAGVANLDANDGLVPVEVNENLLAVLPESARGDEPVPVLLGARAGPVRAVAVDRRDWPRFRDALADGLFAPFAAVAVSAAVDEGAPVWTPGSHARILHIGEVPGDDIGIAASAVTGDRTVVSFASGRAVEPDVDVLGIARRGATALAARSLERSPAGPWLVVAGSPNIVSLVLGGDDVRNGNFALLEDSSLSASSVRGRLESGREVRPVGP